MDPQLSSAAVRASIFVAVLAALVCAEAMTAGPNPAPRRRRRWPGNLLLGAATALVTRLFLPIGLAGIAFWARDAGLGLFNVLAWPHWLEFALSLVLLDGAIYWQHRLMHAWPWLWRLHRVHHTDTTLDTTSALRFHPLEIIVSLAIKLALVVALGVPADAVLAFEILLSSLALATHANLALPPRLDRAVRWLLVTPNMHRIHHSTRGDEQHRNFGFNLSIWDRVFSSYAHLARDQPQAFGVEGVPPADTAPWRRLLREPFVERG